MSCKVDGNVDGKSKTGGSIGLFGSFGSKALSGGGETTVDGAETSSGDGFIEVSVDGFTEGVGFIEDVRVDGFNDGLMVGSSRSLC